MKKFINTTLLLFTFSFLFFLFFGTAAFAANQIYLGEVEREFSPASEFAVPIYLETDEAVNALSLTISYPAGVLKFLDFDERNSIINIWPNKPQVISEGRVGIEGGSLSPVSGKNLEVGKIIFRAINAGEATIEVNNAKLYKADGLGTEISVPSSLALFSVSAGGRPFSLTPIEDETPPRLTARVVEEPLENKKLIVFETGDKESGVVEVQLRSKKWFSWSEWLGARNPVVLPQGVWLAEIRAANRAGLQNTASVFIWQEAAKKLGFIGLSLIFVLLLIFFLYKQIAENQLNRSEN